MTRFNEMAAKGIKGTSAPAVSARLHKAGFAIVASHHREGIRVSRGALRGSVRVTVDLDMPGKETRLADLVTEELIKWEGYDFTRNGNHFTVTKHQ
jgi:hypothetical protein